MSAVLTSMLLGAASTPGGNGMLTSLVGYWKLDGDATDASGNGLNGTATSVSWVSAIINQGASFSGSANVDLTGNAALKTQQMSVAGWFKWGAFTTDNRAASDWHQSASLDRWLVYDNGTGVVDGYMNTAANGVTFSQKGPVSFGTLSTGTWYHLALTYDGSIIKSYRNGANIGTLDTSASSGTTLRVGTGSTLRLGKQAETGPGSSLIIDEFGYWSAALSGAQVSALYNSGAGLAYPF